MARPRYRRPSLHSESRSGQDGAMPGAVVIAFVLVVVIPVAVLVSGAVASGILGHFLKREGELSHEGSELIETNV